MTDIDDANDKRIDAWNKGALDGVQGKTNAWPGDPDYSEGHRHGREQAKVRPVLPTRPEGYYHMPIGTFD